MYSLPSNDSSPCLDMHGLDTPFSKKVADDSKIHHILIDSMFQPRKRHKKYVRSQLQEGDSQQNLNLKNHINLRHLITAARFHTYYCGRSPAANNKAQSKKDFLRVEDIADNKPRKNVSFADQLGDVGGPLTKQPSTYQLKSSDDELDEDGIIFTARPCSDLDTSKEYIASSEPTAIERTLPWKRDTELPPLSSSDSFFSISREDVRKQDEFPAWAKNKDYTVYEPSFDSMPDQTSSPSGHLDLSSPYYGTKYTIPFDSFENSPPFLRRLDDSSDAYTESTAPVSTSTDSLVTRDSGESGRLTMHEYKNHPRIDNSSLPTSERALSQNNSVPSNSSLDHYNIPMIDDDDDDADNSGAISSRDSISLPTILIEHSDVKPPVASRYPLSSSIIDVYPAAKSSPTTSYSSSQTVLNNKKSKKIPFWEKLHDLNNPSSPDLKHTLSGSFEIPAVIIHSSDPETESESAL